MKKSLFAVLLLLGAALLSGAHFDRGERRIRISGASRPVTRAEIVLPEANPVRRFAAEELQSFLKRASGLDLPVVAKSTPGVLSLVLGDNALAKKAGLDSGKLVSEAFIIKREGSLIFILGADDPHCDPKVNRWHMRFKRGTLTAAYDFLEFIRGSKLVAHNARFDLSFLQESLARTALPTWKHGVYDSITLIRTAYPGLPSYSLQSLRQSLGLGQEIDESRPHRAGYDAEITMEAFAMAMRRLYAM